VPTTKPAPYANRLLAALPHKDRQRFLAGCEPHAVLLHLIGTEQLCPQRRLIVARPARRAASAQVRSCQVCPDPGANA